MLMRSVEHKIAHSHDIRSIVPLSIFIIANAMKQGRAEEKCHKVSSDRDGDKQRWHWK